MRKLRHCLVSCLMLLSFSAAYSQGTQDQFDLKHIATYATGLFDESSVEIMAYDPETYRVFFINAEADAVTVLDISNPAAPTLIAEIPHDAYGSGVNSIAVCNGIVAVAVEAETVDGNGKVVFWTTDGQFIHAVEVGVLPDMVTFTSDCTKVLTANEGEPSDDYTIDPEGSVSIIDISAGPINATVTTLGFSNYNDKKASLINKGVRIFGLNATVAQDLEPEYIALTENDALAYVSLQENNALAVIDVQKQVVIDILPLGYKDHSTGAPQLATYNLNEVPGWPALGTPAYDGGQPTVMLGGFSGLHFAAAESTPGNFVFYAVPDRGPNGDAVSRSSVTPAATTNLRPYKLPEYQGRIARFTLNPMSGEISLTDQILLTQKDGVTPITGRGNIPGFDETPVTYADPNTPYGNVDFTGNDAEEYHALDFDPFGGDFEGIVTDNNGYIWMCDENRPAIYKFMPSGQLIERYVPEGTSLLGSQPQIPGYYGAETLPAIYSKRRANRGFEAIAYDPVKDVIYAFIQSPIENPNNSVRNKTDVIRILGIRANDGVPVEEYVYLLENNASFNYGISRVDKIGDAVYVGNGQFMILERDSSVPGQNEGKKIIFKIDLKGATNILGTALAIKSTSSGPDDKTLEMMSADDLLTAGVQPVFKIKTLNLPSIGYLPSDKPEGLTVLPDGSLAVINDNDFGLAGAGVSDNTTLGIIRFNDNFGFDASNRAANIEIENWPTLGMFMPDAIASYSIQGRNYIITANEGDARDYDGYSEESRVKDFTLDPDVFPNAATLQLDENLGRLNSTTAYGDIDNDGDVDVIYSYGARSFSIFDQFGNLVFDSGDELEQITARLLPDHFNSNNDENGSRKSRSDDKGPEPEAVEIVKSGGQFFALIGLERVGGVMVYNITDPTAPTFVSYLNNRNFDVDAMSPEAGDLGPENIVFIAAEESPTGQPLVLTGNEVSGTLSIFSVSSIASTPNMLSALNTWQATPLTTIGEEINGYIMPGIPDGMGAKKDEDGHVTVFISHELGQSAGYPYTLENGTSLTGARISAITVDPNSYAVLNSVPAYHTIIDRAGDEVTSGTQIDPSNNETQGMRRFCSAALFEAGSFNLEDDIFFTGEETGGGQEFALDVESGILYALPWLGRAAWENLTMLDPGNPDQIAIAVGDDRAPAPLLLYIGKKVPGGNFLERNGLANGKLYVFAANGVSNPEEFNGTGNTLSGTFLEIDYYRPDLAGNGEYDAQGFATQQKQDELAIAAGAFLFSRPEDLATNPVKLNQFVLASTGRGQLYPSDDVGTTYIIDVNFSDLACDLRIVYDGDDAGNRQFAGPDFGLRSPDNLDWADDGYIYLQEDRSTSINVFGRESGEEASIWQLNPVSGKLVRIARVDRSAIPANQTDIDPDDLGDWETSGILDVSSLFGAAPDEVILIGNVQAHSVRGGIIDAENLVQGGQIFILKGDRTQFTGAPLMLAGLNDYQGFQTFTVGENVAGYYPPGILDGLGAKDLGNGTIRVFASHELRQAAGYPYTLSNGTALTGARISYFDMDSNNFSITGSALAYHTIIDRSGNEVTSGIQIDPGNSETDGARRFCSAILFEAGDYGLVDDLFFTGEETAGGQEFALDIESGILYALPWLGRAAWENLTLLDTRSNNRVAILVGDDRAGAPLLLYVGEKDPNGNVLGRNGLSNGKLYVFAGVNANTPEQFKGTGNKLTGKFVEIDYYRPDLAGNGEYDTEGFATQEKQDELAIAAEAFLFSRPEDLATNPSNGSQAVLASTGRGQLYPSDDWGTTYLIDVNFRNDLTTDLTILYDGDDAGNGQFSHPDFGLRSPDNLDWASDGFIYLQEDKSTRNNVFGGTSGEEASVWKLNPLTGELTRIAQVDRTAIPNGQQDIAPADLGNWETSGIIDVSNEFHARPDEIILLANVQAHSLGGGTIDSENLAQGGQLVFLRGPRQALKENLVQLKGLNGWNSTALFTVGETVNGYTAPGILDGLGAISLNDSTMRVLANHELGANVGYQYSLNNGTMLTGARVSYFDIHKDDLKVMDAGLAYHTIIDRAGNEVTSGSQIDAGNDDLEGLRRLCGANLFEAGEYSLENTIFFTGEETSGGQEFGLDVENRILYTLPWLGRAAWENVTLLETGSSDQVAILVGDDRAPAPLILYVGQKNTNGEFLAKNGLNNGKLFVFVGNGASTPEEFKGTGNSLNGRFVEIDHYRPDLAGNGEYDAQGFATQAKQDELAAAVGAFLFSRPEDVATNPADGTQAVLASTGRGQLYPSDDWGVLYTVDISFVNLGATLQIIYDGDDAGNGQFSHPDEGLRNPDNLEWAEDGFIYVQEDRSTSINVFGGTSAEEASVWRVNPISGRLTRIGQVDRTVVPVGQVDTDPDDLGDWETSGVMDVSTLFGLDANSSEVYLLLDVQAHSVRRGIIDAAGLVQGGQLVLLTGPRELASALREYDEDQESASGIAAFPNPFDSEVTLEYELKRHAEIRVNIYTLTGQHVAKVFEGQQSAGLQQLTWNTAADSGQELKNGIYVCQLMVDGHVSTRKLILVK